MFDFDKIFSTEYKEVPWFDVEFLMSEELEKFYRNWKDTQKTKKEQAKVDAEKEKRRQAYEALKKEFGEQ